VTKSRRNLLVIVSQIVSKSMLDLFECCIMIWLQLYTRITKQGWFDSNKEVYIFRGVIDDVNQFLAVCVLWLMLISYL